MVFFEDKRIYYYKILFIGSKKVVRNCSCLTANHTTRNTLCIIAKMVVHVVFMTMTDVGNNLRSLHSQVCKFMVIKLQDLSKSKEWALPWLRRQIFICCHKGQNTTKVPHRVKWKLRRYICLVSNIINSNGSKRV